MTNFIIMKVLIVLTSHSELGDTAEFPDYYTRLEKMEEAKHFWASRKNS